MFSRPRRRKGTFDCVGNFGVRGAIAALAALIAGLGGCNRDEVIRAFRDGSSDQLQAGVESIALGIINGAFSAFDLGGQDSGSANTSGATAGAGDTSGASETP